MCEAAATSGWCVLAGVMRAHADVTWRGGRVGGGGGRKTEYKAVEEKVD